MKAVLFAALLVSPTLSFAADRLVDWPGGNAQIRSHGPDGGLTMGQVAPDGTVSLSLTAPPASHQTLAQTFPPCDEAGTALAAPADTDFTPTSPYLSRDGKELGGLHLVSAPAVMTWRASFGQATAVEGSWGQWVYVDRAATVKGRCETPMFSDPEGTDGYTQTMTYQANLRQGWNLLRQRISALHTTPAGTQVPQAIIVDAVTDSPADLQWTFEAY